MSIQIVRREPVADAHLPSELHPILRQIYASRDVASADELNRQTSGLLHFQQLNGINTAVALIAQAIERQKRIYIIGDFDADGATSTALMMLGLRGFGARNLDFLVPNRFDFGYGLSPGIVAVAHEHGAELIITVDSGIACFAGVEAAKAEGIDVIITDHHLPAEQLPPADAIVNPNLKDCDFPSKHLAGVGVAFYLLLALRRHLAEGQWLKQQGITPPNLADYLDIVALGTVADVVCLDSNNRILVHQGLQRIRSGRCRPGIKAMLEVADRNPHRLQASDLGFVLGPRLNAAGRLDDMTVGIQCLLTHKVGEARMLAQQLDSLNRERREIESGMQQEAEAALQQMSLNSDALPCGLVLYQEDWHQGIIGILAGRIKDKHHRPVIAFAHQDDHILKGSARSISGVHIRDLLEELNRRHPDIMDKFGGHAAAAGLSLPVDNLPAFEQAFTALTAEMLAGQSLQAEVVSDGALPQQALTLDFCQLLSQSGPWGQGFPEPVFDDEFELLQQRIVGSKHLKLLLRKGQEVYDAIAFNIDLQQWPNHSCQKVQLAFTLDGNEFRGKTSLQLMVKALKPAVGEK